MRSVTTTALIALCASAAQADFYHPIGNPGACGTYDVAEYNGQSWFPGGAGSLIRLDDPVSLRGLDGTLYDAVMTEEGLNDPVGRYLFLHTTQNGQPVLLVTSPQDTTAFVRCP